MTTTSREFRIAPYDPLWPLEYAAEAERIARACDDLPFRIEHVGSTAVPGLVAKPILDIAVAIHSYDMVPLCATALARVGYQYAHWVELENDYTFEKGVERTHHVHLVEHGSRQWGDYLRFRDALRANIELARDYERTKIELGAKFCGDRAAYTRAKADFIRHVLSVT